MPSGRSMTIYVRVSSFVGRGSLICVGVGVAGTSDGESGWWVGYIGAPPLEA